MLKKIAKGGGITIGIIAVILGSTILYSTWYTNHMMNKTYTIDTVDITIPTDSISIEKGKHIAHIRGCVECHSSDLSGKVFANDGFFGRLTADNLTTGEGGIGTNYTTEDWINAIRHGVRPNGKPVIFMPSHEFNVLSETDLQNLIAYLQQVPAVDKTFPENDLNTPVKVMYAMTGAPHLVPADLIDHSAPLIKNIDKTDPVKFGKYLSTTCMGCHQSDFTGGPIAGVPPDWPEATNITGDAYFSSHTLEDFEKVLRTGVNAEGRKLNGTYMPWPVFKHMTDEEINALYAFLKTQ